MIITDPSEFGVFWGGIFVVVWVGFFVVLLRITLAVRAGMDKQLYQLFL